ncbi:MAG TPA: tripartite tricarboxylate transporter substrate binding protein [Candidatus Sulfotelmatobacter sp.]|nr:tripartite tricarboxylate transporter substrate binding protein [Candidatus Sulfotelmatobacter sp.]
MRARLLAASVLTLVVVAMAAPGECARGSEADRYPTKPITYLVVWDPGGQSDRTARLQQPLLEKMLGQKIVIDYKVGGGGAVGWAQFVRTKPDGYTIVGTNLPTIVTQPLMQDVGYKTEQFIPICDFQYTPMAIAVRKDSPYKSLQDLITAAKANPNKVSIGGVALWSITHILVLQLEKDAGIKVQFVPHSGSASMVTNVLGGHVDAITAYSDDMVRLRDQIRPLAFATKERFPGFETVPTMKELGFDYDMGVSRGVAVPAGAPEYAAKKLEKAFVETTRNPEIVEQMRRDGFVSRSLDAGQFKGEIARQIGFWKEWLKDADTKK